LFKINIRNGISRNETTTIQYNGNPQMSLVKNTQDQNDVKLDEVCAKIK